MEDKENPLPTPALSPIHLLTSTPNRKSTKHINSTKSSNTTTITLDDTGVTINSRDVRDHAFQVWLEGKKNKNKTTDITTQAADIVISSSNVRETVLHNWLAVKEQEIVRRDREKRMQAIEQRNLLEAELSSRQRKSVGVYESWCKGKDSKRVENILLVQKERERREEQELEAGNKRIEARSMYAAWLEQADRKKRMTVRREREKVSERERRELEDKETKRAESLKMYQAWCMQKDAIQKEEVRTKRDREIKKQQLLERERRDKSENALRAYEAWLEWKEGEQSSPNDLNNIMSPTQFKWKPPGSYIPDYPRSHATKEIDNLMEDRRDQLRVTTAKHSATALSAT